MMSLWREKKEITNFDQEESESLSDTWKRFKLLLRKCPSHNMSAIEHMTHFICGLRTQMIMFLDASVGGTLRLNIDEEFKTLIKNMCQNE